MDTLFSCFSFKLISRTVPGNVQIRGEADTAAIVTVNENPTWRYPSLRGSAAQTSPRSGATSAAPAAPTSPRSGATSAAPAAQTSYFYGGDLASSFTHRFSTKPWCPVTGLYEYQMRKYRPEIGRWLSRDPINENGGANLFLFLFNSPILPALDYLGTDPCKIGGSCSVHGRGDEGQFDSIACSCSKNMLPVRSGKELLEHLKTLTRLSDDCCISHYTIAGHGWRNHSESTERSFGPGIPSGGDDDGFYDDTNNKNENARSIDDLQKAIEAGEVKFCSSCSIQIYACRVSPSFSHKLAVVTGCSVVAASASCSEAEGKWHFGPESSAEKQKGRYFGFYRCLPSGNVHIIGPSYEPFIQ